MSRPLPLSLKFELSAAILMLFCVLNSVPEFLTPVLSLKLNVLPLSVQTDPKRLKKELPKALKTIKGEDRLMLVGTTNAPFDGELKPMMSTYQKIIVVPRPDYASRHGTLRLADVLNPSLFIGADPGGDGDPLPPRNFTWSPY